MRIEHLYLENFGIHKSRRLVFGDGLQVVFGPNESGKTTLLAALRQTLFGMPHISAYAFDGSPVTKARVQLADGRKIEVHRKKTRGPGLNGEFEETREPLTVEAWEKCLTGATAGLFENLFAISLQELASGEESLRSAGLAESLFGIAMGGMTRFRQLDDRLREQSEQLFSSSANARKPKINSLIREIQAAEREYEQARFSNRDYTGLREEIEEHESLAERLRIDWDDQRRLDRRLERIEAALPIWRQAELLRSELADLGPGAAIPASAVTELRELSRKRDDVLAELEKIEGRVASPVAEQPLPAGELLTVEPIIRSLSDRVAGVRSALAEREALTAELTELEQRITHELANVQPGWTAADLSRVTASLAQRETAQRLSEESARLDQAAASLQERRSELEVERDRIEAELRALPSLELLPGCRELLQRSQQYRLDCERLQTVQSHLNQLQAQIERQRQQLARQVNWAPIADLGELPVPLAATIDSFVARTEPLERSRDQARSRVDDAATRFASAREELARFDQDHDDCDRAALLKLREEREVGWALVAGQLSGNPDQEAIHRWTAGHPERLLDLYRERVVAADLMADRLLADAARVAQRQHLVNQVERCEGEVADLTGGLNSVEADLATLQSAWRSLWPAEPFCPRSPREMAEWLKQFTQWQQLTQQAADLATEQSQRATSIEAFESELLRAFPGAASRDLAQPEIVRSALLTAAELERQLSHAEQSRPRLEGDLRLAAARLESVEREQFDLSLAQADVDTRKSEFLTQLGLPTDWEVHVATRVVSRLMEIQSLDLERTATRTRLQRIDELSGEFIEQAQSLFTALQRDWPTPMAACDQVLAWRAELEQRRELELEQSRLLADRSTSEKLIHRLREQRDALDLRIETARKTLPQLAEMPLPALLFDAEQAESLRSELRQLDHQWQAHSDGDAAFADQLREASLDEVREQRLRLKETMRVRDEERARELASAETLRQKLKARADETRPLELGQQVESLRARLGDAIDEWAPLTLARHLMEQARQRFEKNQQPQLLIDAGEIFSQLTLGEYVQLTRAIGKETELLAVPRVGTAKLPREMSTGTREQLYLAIRLAYLKQYSQRAEPLPLVMDDVLVNFDEDRARQTLRVLCDFSEKYQILFLTCHRRMVELVRTIKPDLKPIELKPGSLERPEPIEKVAEVPAESKRNPRNRPRKPDEPEHPVLFR